MGASSEDVRPGGRSSKKLAPMGAPTVCFQASAGGGVVFRARGARGGEGGLLRALPVPLTRLASMRLERPSIGALASSRLRLRCAA